MVNLPIRSAGGPAYGLAAGLAMTRTAGASFTSDTSRRQSRRSRAPDGSCVGGQSDVALRRARHGAQQRRGARAPPRGPLVGIDVGNRKLTQVVVISCSAPHADIVVCADVGAEAERAPDRTHVRGLHQLARSSLLRFPSSLMERSKESRPASPPWWYDTATSTWESGNFRLRACSRIVIAVHAASEALSSS